MYYKVRNTCTYFGFLLPSINKLIDKYCELSKKYLIYCQFLSNVLKNSIEKRFSLILKDPFLLSTSISISRPFFKTVWFKNEDFKDKGLSFFRESFTLILDKEKVNTTTDSFSLDNE